MGKMHPDLMGPAGFQPDLHCGVICRMSQHPVVGHRRLPILPDASGNDGRLRPGNGCRDGAVSGEMTAQHGIIPLFQLSLQSTGGVGILCDHAQTGGIPIQPAHRPESMPRHTGGKVIAQRIPPMPGRGMHRHARRLVIYYVMRRFQY